MSVPEQRKRPSAVVNRTRPTLVWTVSFSGSVIAKAGAAATRNVARVAASSANRVERRVMGSSIVIRLVEGRPFRLAATWHGVRRPLHPRKRTTRRLAGGSRTVRLEATTGFEPVNRGFADPRVEPLHHVAPMGRAARSRGRWLPLEDSNLGSRIQSPLSYH